MKAIVENDVIGDNRLLRGEIMTITDIMRVRLRSKTLRPHIVAPVQSLFACNQKESNTNLTLVDAGALSHGSTPCPCFRGRF